jgi:hypothetical protein
MVKAIETASADNSAGFEEEQIPAVILAVIAAAAYAFLGQRVRIRGLELKRSPRESVSKWTQQGRTSVQTSHNLRSNK